MINEDQLKRLKKTLREQRLERETVDGRPRAKTFDGLMSSKQERRRTRMNLRNLNIEELYD